jgi:hypothetical protein
MLQTMQQTLVSLHAQPQAPPPPRDRLGDFQLTKSPTFSYDVEPMDADDWLKSVEKKLQVVQCNNREKVLLASHQLSGPTADWWDAYMEAHEEPESINWPELRAKEEGVSGFETGVHVCERVRHQVYSTVLLRLA